MGNRYRQFGELSLHDRSSAPHHQPTAIPAEVVARIESMRREHKWSALATKSAIVDALSAANSELKNRGQMFIGPIVEFLVEELGPIRRVGSASADTIVR
jgi:hypothetical protein